MENMNEEQKGSVAGQSAATSQTKKGVTHWAVVILAVTAIFIATTFVLSLLNRDNGADEVHKDVEVSEQIDEQNNSIPEFTIEERQAMLDELSESGSSTLEISIEEREAMLDALSESPSVDEEAGISQEAAVETELSFEDRQAMLEDLVNSENSNFDELMDVN